MANGMRRLKQTRQDMSYHTEYDKDVAAKRDAGVDAISEAIKHLTEVQLMDKFGGFKDAYQQKILAAVADLRRIKSTLS
jgi:hypothetical protein